MTSTSSSTIYVHQPRWGLGGLSLVAQEPFLLDGTWYPTTKDCIDEHYTRFMSQAKAPKAPGKDAKAPKAPGKDTWWSYHLAYLMRRVVWSKCRQRPHLAKALLATGKTPLIGMSPRNCRYMTYPNGEDFAHVLM